MSVLHVVHCLCTDANSEDCDEVVVTIGVLFLKGEQAETANGDMYDGIQHIISDAVAKTCEGAEFEGELDLDNELESIMERDPRVTVVIDDYNATDAAGKWLPAYHYPALSPVGLDPKNP